MSSNTNREEDEDTAFLEHVLDKLYDFGSAPKKKSQKKKKKRRRCEEDEDEDLAADICSDTEESRAEHAGAEQPEPSKTDQRGEAARQLNQVEVVTFQDPRKKQKTKQTTDPDKTPAPQITEQKQTDQLEELNLEKARLEVHRFGITGYKKEEQRVFERDRAVMLGARPPKKGYVNYKVLQQQIKEKKQKAKEEVQPDLKKKKKKSNPRDRKKTVSSGSGSAPSGQVGRFKNGMLILSSKEIQKIKGKRGRK